MLNTNCTMWHKPANTLVKFKGHSVEKSSKVENWYSLYDQIISANEYH